MTKDLEKFAKKNGGNRFIYASTMSVYGVQPNRPIREDDFCNPESFSLPAVYSSGPSSPVEIGSWTFNIVGTYTYDCSIGSHAASGMVGSITVTPAGEYPGCMDTAACNYSVTANIEDGSCKAVVIVFIDTTAYNYNQDTNK